MISTPAASSRLRRLPLLLAALLHLFGVAALPALHPAVGPRVTQTHIEKERQGPTLPAHDDQHCLVCQGMGATALPAEASPLVLAAERTAAVVPEDRRPAPLRPRSTLRARAPPALA
jgi:hypothetical protein